MSGHAWTAKEWATRIHNLICDAEADGYEVEVTPWDQAWDDVSNPRLVIWPKGTILPSDEAQVWPPKEDA